jgi:hypothetical protein
MSWGAEARDGRVVDQVGVHAGDDHVAVIDGHGLPGLGEEDLKLDGVHAQPLDPVALQQGASAPQAVGMPLSFESITSPWALAET